VRRLARPAFTDEHPGRSYEGDKTLNYEGDSMTGKTVEYRVYRNGKSKAALPNEHEAFEYLKRSAARHRKAEFVIERREVIFNSLDSADDKKRLNELRRPERDNAIHASIHRNNWDIGR
jgi:hypothetical protein